jgi:hypothetical protein
VRPEPARPGAGLELLAAAALVAFILLAVLLWVTQGAYVVDHPGETDPVGVVEQPDPAPPPPPPPVTVPVDAERVVL